MDVLYGNSLGAFLVLTVVLGGAAAWMTGRAVAIGWQPVWHAVLAMVPLSAAVRFLHFALFEGELLSLQYYLVTLAILVSITYVGYRVTRTTQLAQQYPWLYERSGPLSVRSIGTAE